MPYVKRDGSGAIQGVFMQRQDGLAEELLPDDDPGVVAYLNPPPVSPEDSPLTPEDEERWMRMNGATPAVIAGIKRDRGKPMPS